MQTVNFQCGHCRNLMAVGTDFLGQQVRCPHCQQVVIAPPPPQSVSPFAAPSPAPPPSPPGADAGPSSTGYNGAIQALGLFADRLVGGRPSTDWAALPDAAARPTVWPAGS